MASIEPLKLLLSLGFDPNMVNDAKETPLFIAARTNNIDAACVLIEQGVDFRSKNSQGQLNDTYHSKSMIKISLLFILGQTAFDFILDLDEWLGSKKFDDETHARLRAYKYKDIRTLMYTVSSKLNLYDARLASNRNTYLQRSYQKLTYELNQTQNDVYESPRLRRR